MKGYNVIGIFHGHQHETPNDLPAGGLDLFKPKAAFMGGFAVVRMPQHSLWTSCWARRPADHGEVAFTNAFSKGWHT